MQEGIETHPQVQRALAVPAGEHVPHGFALGFLGRWLSEYRDIAGQLRTFDLESAEALFERLPQAAALEAFPAIGTVPLFEFESDLEEVELDSGVAIVSLERHRLARRAVLRGLTLPLFMTELLGTARYAIRIEFTIPRDEAVDFAQQVDRSERVISALRLLKRERVSMGSHTFEIGPPAFRLPFTFLPHLVMRRGAPSGRIPRGDSFRLSQAEVPPLQEIFRKLETHRDDERLVFAVRRYNDASERQRPEDQIVDSWSALEALFASDSTQEVTFRVSVRRHCSWAVVQRNSSTLMAV